MTTLDHTVSPLGLQIKTRWVGLVVDMVNLRPHNGRQARGETLPLRKQAHMRLIEAIPFKLPPTPTPDMSDRTKIEYARIIRDEIGGLGNRILASAATLMDFTCTADLERFKWIATQDLSANVDMRRLRLLAKFWAWSVPPCRTKASLVKFIVATYATAMHHSYRPRSHRDHVIADCPAKYYVHPDDPSCTL